MTPFRTSGHVFHARVYDRTGAGHVRSLGTRDEAEAQEFETMLERFRRARRWDVLDLVIAKKRAVPDVYDADAAGTLAQLVQAVRDEDAARAAEDDDPDLDPLVTEWAEAGAEPTYVQQVRRLIPAGQRFPLSAFRRKRVSEHLASLRTGKETRGVKNGKVQQSTRDRHKAGLSAFAKFLIERELLETNPTRDLIRKRSTKPKAIIYLEPKDVRRLVEALPEPFRSLEALMAATGMEWQTCAALRRADVDLTHRLIYADGGKNRYRRRWVQASEAWAWAIVERHVKALPASAPVFDPAVVTNDTALDAHHAAAKALGLRYTTLHHHRHSFAVMWIRRSKGDAERLQWLKNQLGHAPQSTLIYTTYGVFINAAKLTKEQEQRVGGLDRE